MFRKLTLSFLLTVCICFAGKFSFAANVTINGASNTNYTLGAGDTLFIGTSGNYTGTISGLTANNRVIVVAGGGIFNPSGLIGSGGGNNTVVCKMHIYGTFTFASSITTNTNFSIDIYAGGMATLAAMSTKGQDQVWTVNIGGTLNFTGDVSVNGGTLADNNNIFVNHETINASGNFTMKSGSNFTNYKNFNVTGNFTANGGVIDNQGNTVITGLIDLNSGASSITNRCRMQASGGISVSNGFFYNYSYLWAKNSDVTLSSGGTIQNILLYGVNVPIIHGKNYTQTGGTINGPAKLWFYGTTKTSGAAVVGTPTNPTTDTIKMYDVTRTVPAQIFDVQGAGTVNPNVIFNYWGDPDSNRTYLFGCALEVALEAPLAINWRSFDVTLSNDNIPALIWSADFDRPTFFEIERSYDGRNFSSVTQVASINGKSDYNYNDRSANSLAVYAYYRIKAVELGGEIKYSQIRVVRFKKSEATVQTVPNPFTSNFNISYNSGENGIITIRMFNINGQQKFVKNVPVIKGNNNIDIVEAANLAKGMYIVQLSNSSTIISSNKLIKQ